MKCLLGDYRDYAKHEQTLAFLAHKRGITKRTLQKQFDQLEVVTGEYRIQKKSVVVTMDVTYFDTFGLLLCRSTEQENLYWEYIKHERVIDYQRATEALLFIGYHPLGFVVDGKPGVIKMLKRCFPTTPIQYCQHHQIATIKKYIPQKAQSEAARSLRRIALQLSHLRYPEFEAKLVEWYSLHKSYLNQRTVTTNPKHKRKWRYTHAKLWSAYNSLKHNSAYLYSCQKHPGIRMPNTTNCCDGFFSHLKERINRHRGLSLSRKQKMINYLLENWRE